jgi:hypothetical protein
MGFVSSPQKFWEHMDKGITWNCLKIGNNRKFPAILEKTGFCNLAWSKILAPCAGKFQYKVWNVVYTSYLVLLKVFDVT